MSLWGEVETSKLVAWQRPDLFFLLDRRERGPLQLAVCFRYLSIYKHCKRKLSRINICQKFLPSIKLVCLSLQPKKQISPHEEKKNRNNYMLKQTTTVKREVWAGDGLFVCEQTWNCTGFLVGYPPGRHLIQVHSYNSCLFTPLSPADLVFKVFGSITPMITFWDLHMFFFTVVINFSLKILHNCLPQNSYKSTWELSNQQLRCASQDFENCCKQCCLLLPLITRMLGFQI